MKPTLRKIQEETLPDDFRTWASASIVRPINSFMADVTRITNNGLLFGDNVAAQVIANQSISLPDDWVYLNTSGGPTLQNGWTADSVRLPSFRIGQDGKVQTRGRIAGGTALALLFTLPSSYRPSFAQTFACNSNGAYGAVTVNPDGTVAQTVGLGAQQDLDGISFDAATRQPVPSAVWPKLYKSTLNTSPVGVWLINCVDQANPRALNPVLSVDWEWVSNNDGTFIKVKNIPGLLPLRKYQFTLLAVAG